LAAPPPYAVAHGDPAPQRARAATAVGCHREHIRLGFGRDTLSPQLPDRLAPGAFMPWIASVLLVIYGLP